MGASNYICRRLTHEQMMAIRASRRDGMSARSLTMKYQVSLRSIYRALERDGSEVREVMVDDWRAEFEMTDEGPIRVSQWVPVH